MIIRPILVIAVLALLTAGCSTLGSSGKSGVRQQNRAVAQQKYKAKKNQKQESWLASWFQPEEPPPPKSVGEWMKLKPMRWGEPSGD